MTRGRLNRFSDGEPIGLPTKATRIPFGQDCSYKDELDLFEAQAHVVVTVLAAEAVGLGPVTQQQMAEVCQFSVHGVHALARMGWLECVGKLPGSRAKLWSGTKKAWRVLGLAGWKVQGAA